MRRVQVARRLLPRALGEYPDSKRFDLTLKSIMRATSQLRDLDTLLETLGTQPMPVDAMINLQNQRSDLAASAREVIASLAATPAPRLRPGQVKGRRVSKRLRTRIRKQGRAAADLVQVVVSDDSKATELHSLRKEVKKLRYLLELAGRGDQEVTVLTDWQESLGAIHDLDVAIVYLQGKGPEFARTVRNIQRIRHTRYLGFVNRRVVDSTNTLGRSKILARNPLFQAPPT